MNSFKQKKLKTERKIKQMQFELKKLEQETHSMSLKESLKDVHHLILVSRLEEKAARSLLINIAAIHIEDWLEPLDEFS